MNHQFFLQILQFKESCNLIGQKYFGQNLWHLKNTFQVLFFQLHFNEKLVINGFTKNLVILKWLSRQKCKQKSKTMSQKYVTGFLRYKTIFYNKVALNVQLMNFFIWRKNVSFLRYLDICVFVKSTDFKIHGIIISIAT